MIDCTQHTKENCPSAQKQANWERRANWHPNCATCSRARRGEDCSEFTYTVKVRVNDQSGETSVRIWMDGLTDIGPAITGTYADQEVAAQIGPRIIADVRRDLYGEEPAA